MSALLRFIIILALALPVGILAYFVPQELQAKLVRFWREHPRLAKRAPVVALAMAILTYVSAFSTLAILRHLSLGTHAFDLGVYDQVIWNSAQGRLFEFSLAERPVPEPVMSYLGFHFSPGLLLLVPFYLKSRGRARERNRPVLLAIVCFILAASALSYYFHGHGPLSKGYDPLSYAPVSSSSAVFRAMALIPAGASVSAHRDIGPQLSHRRFIYLFPDIHDADFLLFWEGRDDDLTGESLAEWKDKVAAALVDPRYELLLREEGFVLMRKRTTKAETSEIRAVSDIPSPIL